MNNIINSILADLQGQPNFSTEKALIHNGEEYFPTARTYASPKFANETLKALTFLIQHPAVIQNGKMKRESAFMDLPQAVSNAYHTAAMERMQEFATANIDYCIGPKFVAIKNGGLHLAILNGQYADVDIRPNWTVGLAVRPAVISIGGRKLPTSGVLDVGEDTLRIFAGNSPNPLYVGMIDWKKQTLTTNKPIQLVRSLPDAVEAMGSDPKLMRYYKNMPEEILVKRLESLWKVFAEKQDVKNEYFRDQAIQSTFITESYDALSGKIEVLTEVAFEYPTFD